MIVANANVFAQGNLTIYDDDSRTISTNTTVNNVTIREGYYDSYITIRNGATLTINGNLTIGEPQYRNTNKYIDIQSGTLIVKGNVIMASTTGASRDCYIYIRGNSTVTIEGNIIMNSTDSRRNYFRFEDDGVLNIAGAISGGGFSNASGGGGDPMVGTVNYTNTSTTTSQAVGAYTYNNLNLSSGNFLASGTVTVNGNFKTDGLFNSNGNKIYFNGITECGNGRIEANDEYIYYAPTAQYIIKGNYRGLFFRNGGVKGTHYTCGDISVLGRTRFENASGTEIHTEYDISFNTITARPDAYIYASNNATITYSGNSDNNIISGE